MRLAVVGLLALAIESRATFAQQSMPTVTGARSGLHPNFTRLVLEIDKPATFTYFIVDGPRRLVLDFAELDLAVPAKVLAGLPVGAIGAIQYDLSEPATSRFVVDLTESSKVSKAFIIEPTDGHPYRFVLDLEPIDDAAFVEQALLALPAQAALPVTSAEIPVVTALSPGDAVQVAAMDTTVDGDDDDAVEPESFPSPQAGANAEDDEDVGDGGSLLGSPVIQELTGLVLFEGRFFPNPPRWDGQERHSASFVLEPEYYVEWEDYTSLTVTAFLRVDSADSNRTHADLREAYLRTVGDDWELGAGFGKVFWGVTESVHLVDIINQTDVIENIDLEDKLGQPMVNLTLIRDWGYVDFFYLPYFRERTFQSRAGRLRAALVVDEKQTTYTSGAGRWHPDFAARYSNSFGDWDVGLYHFYGTSREPTLSLGFDPALEPVLVPRYELINQTGTDVQYTKGAWLWKLEALFRQGQRNSAGEEDNYYAFAGGFEYTLYGIFDSNADLGVLTEYLRDGRQEKATGAFQNDVFLGGRLALNDPQDTSLLFGVIEDLTYRTRLLSLEATRRLGDRFTIGIEARLFTNVDQRDTLDGLRDDDLIQIELGYYF